MKNANITAIVIGAILVGVAGAMAATNPAQESYETFATTRLTAYLDENACSKVPDFLGSSLQEQCGSFLQDNRAQIQQLISQNTERRNFWVLSIYETELLSSQILPPGVSQLVPSYHIETIAVFNQFRIYKAERI